MNVATYRSDHDDDEARQRDERGSISAFVVAMTAAVVLCAGLVFDGGRLVEARVEAADLAQNAARAGAQQTSKLRGSSIELDPSAAASAAKTYLASQGAVGSVAIVGDEVVVTVTVTRTMTLLGAAGVGPKTVTATRSAQGVSA